MRVYYRCRDCLEIAVLDNYAHGGKCDCNGPLDLMGKVSANNRMETVEERCKCDRRCTFARGPSCDCVCQGANHGAGMEAEIEVVVDKGAPPRLKARKCLAVRLATVANYRAALDKAIQTAVIARNAQNFRESYRISELARNARRAKCQHVRTKLLKEFSTPPAPVVMRPMVAVDQPATVQGGLFA